MVAPAKNKVPAKCRRDTWLNETLAFPDCERSELRRTNRLLGPGEVVRQNSDVKALAIHAEEICDAGTGSYQTVDAERYSFRIGEIILKQGMTPACTSGSPLLFNDIADYC